MLVQWPLRLKSSLGSWCGHVTPPLSYHTPQLKPCSRKSGTDFENSSVNMGWLLHKLQLQEQCLGGNENIDLSKSDKVCAAFVFFSLRLLFDS